MNIDFTSTISWSLQICSREIYTEGWKIPPTVRNSLKKLVERRNCLPLDLHTFWITQGFENAFVVVHPQPSSNIPEPHSKKPPTPNLLAEGCQFLVFLWIVLTERMLRLHVSYSSLVQVITPTHLVNEGTQNSAHQILSLSADHSP